jgi:DNA-binding transcriptional regulator YhcF (GntR family)
LAIEIKVSIITVKRAYLELEREGVRNCTDEDDLSESDESTVIQSSLSMAEFDFDFDYL